MSEMSPDANKLVGALRVEREGITINYGKLFRPDKRVLNEYRLTVLRGTLPYGSAFTFVAEDDDAAEAFAKKRLAERQEVFDKMLALDNRSRKVTL